MGSDLRDEYACVYVYVYACMRISSARTCVMSMYVCMYMCMHVSSARTCVMSRAVTGRSVPCG